MRMKEVEAGALLRESAQASHQAVERLVADVRRIARSFEQRDLAVADRDFTAFLAALRPLATVTAMLVGTRGTSVCRSRLDRLTRRLCHTLDAVMEHQAQRQWHGVARELEAQLVPALDQWSSILLAVDVEIEAERRDARASTERRGGRPAAEVTR